MVSKKLLRSQGNFFSYLYLTAKPQYNYVNTSKTMLFSHLHPYFKDYNNL